MATKKAAKSAATSKASETPDMKPSDPTPAATESNMRDLGLIKLGATSKVFVNRVPSKSNAIVVNYKNSENYYRISCVIPPNSYTINVEDGESWEDDEDEEENSTSLENASRFKIDSPTLLFTAQYATLPKPTVGTQFDAMFSIFALNAAQPDHIAVKPYMLSNTYADGRICMGGFAPISLLKAFNIYWGSVFNDELFHHVHEMVEGYRPDDMFTHVLNFHTHMLPKLEWKNLTQTVCGKNHWAADKGANGVLITDNQHLLKHIPKEFWREDFNGTPVIITLANLQENVWHFESGNYKFQLPAKSVTTKNTKKRVNNVGLTQTQMRNRDPNVNTWTAR